MGYKRPPFPDVDQAMSLATLSSIIGCCDALGEDAVKTESKPARLGGHAILKRLGAALRLI